MMMGSELNHAHQTTFCMIENVTVEHPRPVRARPFVIVDGQAHRFVVWNIGCIFPRKRPDRLSIVIKDLKEKSVKMKRVGPLGLILDRPDLRFADRRRDGQPLLRRSIVDAVLDVPGIELNQGHVHLNVGRS